MIKSLIITLGIVLALPLIMAASTHAADITETCKVLSAAQRLESTTCSGFVDKNGNFKKNADNPLFGDDGLLNNITRGIALVAGSVAVIFMIIGGYKMILSNSDKQAFTNGRNTLIYAAVGLVVITIAQALVSFIITRIT